MCRLYRSVCAALVAATLLTATNGQATENASPAAGAAEHQEAERAPADGAPGAWYGWQILLVDAASVGAFSLALKSRPENGPVAVSAYVVWLTAGSVIRSLHDAPGPFWSLGRRLLLPLGGALVGALAASGSHGSEGALSEGIVTIPAGAAIGAGIAMLWDWVAAVEPGRPEQREGLSAVTPVVVATAHTKVFGVALRF